MRLLREEKEKVTVLLLKIQMFSERTKLKEKKKEGTRETIWIEGMMNNVWIKLQLMKKPRDIFLRWKKKAGERECVFAFLSCYVRLPETRTGMNIFFFSFTRKYSVKTNQRQLFFWLIFAQWSLSIDSTNPDCFSCSKHPWDLLKYAK